MAEDPLAEVIRGAMARFDPHVRMQERAAAAVRAHIAAGLAEEAEREYGDVVGPRLRAALLGTTEEANDGG